MIDCAKTDLYELNIFNNIERNSKLHFHNNICICTLKKGEMVFFHDGEEITLSPNKIIVFNVNQPHKLKRYKNILEYHILHINLDGILLPKIIEDTSVYKEFINFSQKALKNGKSDFIERFLKTYKIDKKSKGVNENLEIIKKYIDKNIDKNISLEEMAKKVNLNQSYLSRSFKKKYGLSPHNYMLNERVNRAKKLLEEGLDISQIALELGFYDQAHFYKAFKNSFLITPNEYKNIGKNRTISNS